MPANNWDSQTTSCWNLHSWWAVPAPWLFTMGFMSLGQHIGITLTNNWSGCLDKQRAKTLVTQLLWTFGMYWIQIKDMKTCILESRLLLTEEGFRGSEAQVGETWPGNSLDSELPAWQPWGCWLRIQGLCVLDCLALCWDGGCIFSIIPCLFTMYLPFMNSFDLFNIAI